MTVETPTTRTPSLTPSLAPFNQVSPPPDSPPGALLDATDGAKVGSTPDANPDIHEWLTLADAAVRVGVHTRTLRRWAATGRVVSRMIERDGHQVKLIRADTIPDTRDDGKDDSHLDARDGSRDDARADANPDNKDGAQDAINVGARGDATEVRARLDQALREVEFLRAQLERRDQAEAELRRLLLVAQQSLQSAIERPMLPAAGEVQGTKRRVRWWNPATWKR